MSLNSLASWDQMASATPILYSTSLLAQFYAILINFPRPSNGFAYPLHFAALFVLSGSSFILSGPLILSHPRPTSLLNSVGNTLMALGSGLFAWCAWTTQRGRLSAIFGGKTPSFIIDTGPYAHVRHPTYTAYLLQWSGMLAAVAARYRGWTTPTLAACVLGLAGVYRAGARIEEKQFLDESQNENDDARRSYQKYMTKVKYMWLPGVI